jgi:quinol monooxygenase YgiN
MANKPGFRKAIVAKYLGDGTRHTVLRCWEDEAAYLAFRAGPDGNYGRGRPEGLYTNDPVVPQWNSLWETFGLSDGAYLVKQQWQVPDAAWDAFSQQEQAMAELARDASGLCEYQLLRAKDRDQALAMVRYTDRAAFEALVESPDYAEARKALPDGVQHVSTHCYEIVTEVGPT